MVSPLQRFRLPRWLYLLRYHRLSQLFARLRNVVRQRWRRKWGVRGYQTFQTVETRTDSLNALRTILPWKLQERSMRGASERTKQLQQRQFDLLNETLDFSKRIDWQLDTHPEIDALWKFHLHYQEYLLDLVAVARQQPEDSDQLYQLAWEFVENWIEENPITRRRVFGEAWHPFCISRRLPAWLFLWAAHEPNAETQQKVLNSIVNQANFLANNLEVDLGGNHLLENLHALGMAGCCLTVPDAKRWLETCNHRLTRELPEQVTAHGEHFERAPMYHAFMLEIMLNLRDIAAPANSSLFEYSKRASASMADFLQTILHPDQKLPLLSDSVLGQAPPATLLLERATATTPTPNTPHSSGQSKSLGGYWTFREDQHFLIFDAERGFPDHLPAHGHADLLNFEASLYGQRVFVDSGVYTYGAGDMREYCRSTAAHNVLEIDGESQMDMWSRFRVGYRGIPSPLEIGQNTDFHWARATHDAYRRIGVPSVGRWIACRAGGPWLCVDWAEGTERHRLTQRLHLHPSVQVSQSEEYRFDISIGQQTLELQILGCQSAQLESGWYCPEFGKRERNPVITAKANMAGTTALGWALLWPNQAGKAEVDRSTSGEITVSWNGTEKLKQVVAPKQSS